MASWRAVESEAPELAARAREIFDARAHHTIATLRRDGSPRISGTEIKFADGELWWGSMWKAVKALDLRRDPRFALHSGSSDPPEWRGDAKVAGRADEITERETIDRVYGGPDSPEDNFHVFRADLTELVVTGLNEAGNQLVIESWHQGRGVTRRAR